MQNKEQILNMVFVFIATAALGAILGLSILRTVDKRLTDISINIGDVCHPQIPTSVSRFNEMSDDLILHQDSGDQWRQTDKQISSQVERDIRGSRSSNTDSPLSHHGGGVSNLQSIEPLLSDQKEIERLESRSVAGKESKNRKKTSSNQRKASSLLSKVVRSETSLPPSNTLLIDASTGLSLSDRDNLRRISESPDFNKTKDRFDESNFDLTSRQFESHRVSNYVPINPFYSNIDIDHLEANRQYLGRPVTSSKECSPHQFVQGSTDSKYFDRPCGSKSYYKDLSEMTPRQIIKFKQYAKFDKMTVSDYANWLSLHADKPEQLNPYNRKMLQRIKYLTPDDIPRSLSKPLTAQEFWEKGFTNQDI